MAKELLFCKIRREWVAALPEEKVRQALVERMISSLGYPEETLAAEKSLQKMPHLSLARGPLPDRRADLVCFAKGIHPLHDLHPLLLIECKAVKITNTAIQQVIGYNHYLQAPFITIANQAEIQTGWYNLNKKKYQFSPILPPYQELIAFLS